MTYIVAFIVFDNSRGSHLYSVRTVKKISDFPVRCRDVTNQTLPVRK